MTEDAIPKARLPRAETPDTRLPRAETPDTRLPRAYEVSDPRVVLPNAADSAGRVSDAGDAVGVPHRPRAERAGATRELAPEAADSDDLSGLRSAPQLIERGMRWAGIMVSALVGLAVLAAGVWFARFVSIAVLRDDWVGWLSLGLLMVGGLAAVIVIGRELVGLFRLGRLGRLRRDADALIATPDLAGERQLIGRLMALQQRDPARAWALASFREHLGDVHDAGSLLAIADRDLMRPIDTAARAMILGSAKRVATVTALSPVATIAVLFVLFENLRLMRMLAALYGGRPHFIGSLRLARNVVVAIVASGGLALTDDMLGQFLGQDLLRRLSRRLGEGAFNGALTARLGAATVDIIRPLPHVRSPPIRARDVVAELFKRTPPEGKPV